MHVHARHCAQWGPQQQRLSCHGADALPPVSACHATCALRHGRRRSRLRGSRRASVARAATEAAADTANAAGRGAQRKQCCLYDLHAQQVPYTRAWAWQKALVRRKLAALDAGDDPADELLVLQHPPVYTLGTGSTPSNLRFPADAPPFGAELHRTERGGEVTYHGPGQLVLYPILNLRHHQTDLHWYMRTLEEVTIRALASLGLQGERIPGLTGTWCAGHKVAAQGVRATRWVTFHGVALNVDPDLSPFGAIVPCGIAERPVGSVAALLAAQGPGACCVAPGARDADVAGGESALPQPALDSGATVRGARHNTALVYAARGAMLHAFQQVFDVQLVAMPPAPSPQGPAASASGAAFAPAPSHAPAVEALLDAVTVSHGDGATM